MPVTRMPPIVLRALLAAVAVGVIACSPGTVADRRLAHARRAGSDVVIGVAWPWSARRELRFGEGVEMAVDEINAAGGVNGRPLRVMRRDDHESADEGRLVAQQFAADPAVVAVIGDLQSYVAVPAASIYDNAGIVMVAPAATDPELTTQGYRRVFRVTFNDRTAGYHLAEYAARQGYRRVAIEYVRSAYGRALANAFEEYAADRDIVVVARQSYGADGVTDDTFAGVIGEWNALRLDAVFLAGEVPSAAYFIRAARHGALTVPIFGGDALGSTALLDIARESAAGVAVLSVFHPDEPRPEVARFTREFAARYHAVPDAGSALGYDAVHLLAAAMQRARSTVPDSISAALRGLTAWRGVTGAFTFDGAGDVVDKHAVMMVARGTGFEYAADVRASGSLAARDAP